jgi:hypothetical protein
VAVEEARHAGENTISAEAQEHSANQAPGETVRQITRENSGRPPTLLARKSRGPLILAKVANSFEPELLEALEQAVLEGLAEAQKPKPVGLWQLMKKLLSQEGRRVLIATASILQAVGKSLGK